MMNIKNAFVLSTILMIFFIAVWIPSPTMAQSEPGYPIETGYPIDTVEPTSSPMNTPTIRPAITPTEIGDEKTEADEDDYDKADREIVEPEQESVQDTGHDAAMDVPAGGEGPIIVWNGMDLLGIAFGIILLIVVGVVFIIDKIENR